MGNGDMREVVDPLSTTTRVERRWLLVSSVVLVAVTWGGLVPAKIDAFGMEISTINARVLVWLTCLITGYFLAAFIFYYRADHFAVSQSAIETVDFLTDKLVASGANRNVGMTEERFGQVLSAWWDIQLKRYLYPRYRFEFWSAVTGGGMSIVSALVWLYWR
jgi:uncharacterized membrane protein YwzB